MYKEKKKKKKTEKIADVWNSDCTADYSSAGGLKNGASYFWSALQEVNNDVAVGKALRGVLYL